MKLSLSSFLRRPHRRALAAVLAAAVFGLGLLAIAPNWHEALHHDSHQTNHSCAVDLLAHGAAPAAPAFSIESPLYVAVTRLAPARPLQVELIALRRPPGRAPPVA